MTENSDVPRVVYRHLLADEERVLKGFEQEVISVLLKNHMTFRPLWTSRMDPLTVWCGSMSSILSIQECSLNCPRVTLLSLLRRRCVHVLKSS